MSGPTRCMFARSIIYSRLPPSLSLSQWCTHCFLCRHFHFHLYPDTSMFSDDFKMFVNGRPHRSADMTMYYSGQAVGKSVSVCMCTPCVCMYVHAYLHRHVFVVKAVMIYYCEAATGR